jgi:hypothetical protein
MLNADDFRARPRLAVAAAVASLAVLAAGCSMTSDQASAGGHTAPPDKTIVFDIDVTASVDDSFRRSAQDAFADALERLAEQPHGAIDIYVRKINHNPGIDKAAIRLEPYHIDGVHECTNPFDQRCRDSEAKPRSQARVVAKKIRALHVPTAHAGTRIRGALAIAGEILYGSPGEKWLVIASDMRPSHAKTPRRPPVIRLDDVHVVVLFACNQGIAVCQQRRNAWQAEIEHDGAVHPVTFLFSQQMNDLWR